MLLYCAKKLYFMFFLSLLMGLLFLGCAGENKPQAELRSDGNFSAPLPKSLNAANVTQSNLIVEIIIDPEKEPEDRRRLQNLVVDPETKAFSGDIPGVIPAGVYTFRLVFSLNDLIYGEIEVAASGDVNAEVIANQDTPIDFSSAAMNLTDTDGDTRTNLEELERGWDPKSAAPAAPQNLRATAGDQEVALNWNAVAGAESYTIYWNMTGGVTLNDILVSRATDTAFIHEGLLNGTTQYYVITAVGIGGESVSSSQVFGLPEVSWATPEQIEFNSGTAVSPKVSVDSSGNAIAVWAQSDGVRFNIWANRFVPEGGWENAELVESADGEDGLSPTVSIDSGGNAIVVWTQSDGTYTNIWANRFTRGVGWGNAELVEHNDTGDARNPQLAANASGMAVVVWEQFNGLNTRIWSNRILPAGVGWETAELIELETSGFSLFPKVVVDSSGNATAIWQRSDGNIMSNRLEAGASWANSAVIVSDSVGRAESPDIAVDSNGNVMVVWSQNTNNLWGIWTNRFVADLGWGASGLIDSENASRGEYPSIVIDQEGVATAVWEQWTGVLTNIRTNRFLPGAGWGISQLIDLDSPEGRLVTRIFVKPDVVVGLDRKVIAIWKQRDNDIWNLWTNRFVPGVGWEGAELLEARYEGNLRGSEISFSPKGNAVAVWVQSDGTRTNVWASLLPIGR